MLLSMVPDYYGIFEILLIQNPEMSFICELYCLKTSPLTVFLKESILPCRRAHLLHIQTVLR